MRRAMRPPARLALFVAATAAAVASADETTESWVRYSRARAEHLERIGAPDDAAEEWLALGQLLPDDVGPAARAAVLAVDVMTRRGKDMNPGSPSFKLAEMCVKEGVARGGQGDAALAYSIGRLGFAEGKWGVAWRSLGQAKDWGFDPVRARYWHYRAAVNRSLLLVETGRAQEAVDELRDLRAAMPGHPEENKLLVNLATALWRVQDVQSSTKILDELIAKSPGSADAYLVHGLILADQGDLEGAQKRLRTAMLHASASYGDKVYRDALLHLSEVEVKRGRLDEAAAAATQFLALSKDDPDGLYAMGVVLKARNDLPGALKKFRQAARLKPDSLATLANLKNVLSQVGEQAEADEIGKRIEQIHKRRAQEIRDEGGSPALR
jgi:tetratricopeptide (TPR) repeat protein